MNKEVLEECKKEAKWLATHPILDGLDNLTIPFAFCRLDGEVIIYPSWRETDGHVEREIPQVAGDGKIGEMPVFVYIHEDDERIPWYSAIDEKMLLLILRRVHTRLDHEFSTLQYKLFGEGKTWHL